MSRAKKKKKKKKHLLTWKIIIRAKVDGRVDQFHGQRWGESLSAVLGLRAGAGYRAGRGRRRRLHQHCLWFGGHLHGDILGGEHQAHLLLLTTTTTDRHYRGISKLSPMDTNRSLDTIRGGLHNQAHRMAKKAEVLVLVMLVVE